MRWASFHTPDGIRAGVVVGDEVVDLRSADETLRGTVRDFLCAHADVTERVRAAVDSGISRLPLGSVDLLAPVSPRKFFGIGLNYADHVAESGAVTPEHLIVFTKAVTCVTGPFSAVQMPVASSQLDYEGELGFVIGRRCRHVSADDAHNVIAGYVVVNDFSVRDWQLMTGQWTLGKSFDTHGPFGPFVVSADEINDPHALNIRTFVNGEVRQESNTRNLIFNCYKQVEILSTVCTLEPGDVVATGTPGGVANSMPGQPWLIPGDRVRVEIDGVGAIENRITDERIATSASGVGRRAAAADDS